jgi:hypothetical protein
VTDRGLFGCDCGCVWVSAERASSLSRSARHEFHHRPDKSKGAGEILRNTRPFVSIRQMEKCGCKLKWSHFLHMWASLCDDLLFRGRNLLSCRELTSYPFLALAHTHIAKQAIPVMQTLRAAEEKFPLSGIDFQSPQSDLWILDEPPGLKYLPKSSLQDLCRRPHLHPFCLALELFQQIHHSGIILVNREVSGQESQHQKLNHNGFKREKANLIWLSETLCKSFISLSIANLHFFFAIQFVLANLMSHSWIGKLQLWDNSIQPDCRAQSASAALQSLVSLEIKAQVQLRMGVDYRQIRPTSEPLCHSSATPNTRMQIRARFRVKMSNADSIRIPDMHPPPNCLCNRCFFNTCEQRPRRIINCWSSACRGTRFYFYGLALNNTRRGTWELLRRRSHGRQPTGAACEGRRLKSQILISKS